MALELKQNLKLAQQTIMTPQLQQSIKLLQLSRLELQDVIQKEITENPMLEDVEDLGDGDDSPGVDGAGESESAKTNEAALSGDEVDLGMKWENYTSGSMSSDGFGPGNEDDERFSFESKQVKKTSLCDHLIWQLRLSRFTELEEFIGAVIIGNIDGDGYLRIKLEDVSEASGADLAEVQETLNRIQEFDPLGVAARDLKECLFIQAKHLIGENPVVEEILENHIADLEKNKLQIIAKKLNLPLEKIVEATQLISELEPKPGRYFSDEEPQYITPDIFIYKIEDEFHIVLNEGGMPRLRISPFYRNALSQGDISGNAAKDYVQEKIRSAVWLIKSVHQRQRTIYKVIKSIIKFQKNFFEKGIEYLKPLALRDIADDIGMHESTISRVTTNKYAHTPQGIFSLKFFFNSGINSMVGESIASERVKDKIRQIVLSENPRKPYSDQKIVGILNAANIDIARRTVTKYREMLNILPSPKRKKVF